MGVGSVFLHLCTLHREALLKACILGYLKSLHKGTRVDLQLCVLAEKVVSDM